MAALIRQFRFRRDIDEENESTEFQGTVPQSLFMLNGGFLADSASARKGGTLDWILNNFKSTEERVETIFLAILCRRPTDEETREALQYVEESEGREVAYAGVLWMLLNRSEFMLIR